MLLLVLAALAATPPVAPDDDRRQFLRRAHAMETPDLPEEAARVAGDYRFVADHVERIEALLDDHPGRIHPEAIGVTHGGRPLWALHVGTPETISAWREGEAIDKALVFAGIHALEWISTEVAMALLEDVVAFPPDDTLVTVIPLLNPDGRAKVEADLAAGHTDRYRRGNRPNVDLNRDFAVNREARAIWKAIIPGYYSHSDAPLSQPESQALDALAAREHYDRAASLHAFGGYFYYPWSGLHERPPADDRSRHVALGRAMEKSQGAHAYRTRQLGRWGFFFRAHGSELDHLYGEHGTTTFLVELTRSGLHPLRPRTWRTPFRWYNPPNRARHVDKGLLAMKALVWDAETSP